MTISLRKYLSTQPTTKRRMKAVKYLRNRIAHYSKVQEGSVKISKELNQLVVKVHSKRMSPVKVRVDIDKGIANAKPFEVKAQTHTSPQKAAAANPQKAAVATATAQKSAEAGQHKRAEQNKQ